MPDYILNEIIIRNLTPEKRDLIETRILNEEGRLDFNVLLPLPERLRGSWPLGTEMKEVCSIWGTKWNAFWQEGFQVLQKPDDSTIALRFVTANSSPTEWIKALSALAKTEIELNTVWEGKWGWRKVYDFDQHPTEPIHEGNLDHEKHKHEHWRRLFAEASGYSYGV
jgi:hypothetical protein